MALHIQTPLVLSNALSKLAQKNIWLKLDALQPSGSFKTRGVGFACEHYARGGAKRFVSSSGGNAGLAVAYAAKMLQLPAVVVVPQTTSEHAKKLLALEGAEVIVHGASWQEANELAQSMLNGNDAFIHPFDNPLLWQGHATMIDEVAAAGVKPDAVLLSVGGGGLMCGVIEGLRSNHWPDVPVIAVETEGAASLNLALRSGQLKALDAITSIATTLGAKQVCKQAFELTRTHEVKSVVVSDESAVKACRRFLNDHRLLVEPACGAALAPIYEQLEAIQPYTNVLVVVCGGASTTAEQLQSYQF
jgi:L-serine/L-threonine ammonia-lyase